MVNVVVQSLSCVPLFATPWTPGQKHARHTCSSLFPGVSSSSCPLSLWCHLTISSSAAPSPPAFRLSQQQVLKRAMSQLFASGGQSIGASPSASVLSMNVQGWFPLGLTGLSSFLSKGLSRVFSSTTIESISSLALSLIYDPTLTSVHYYCKNHSFDYMDLCWQNDVPAF